MAETQSNAPSGASADPPVPGPASGVIHIRTRLTANFTVIANALAQRRGSAVTLGVAVYILSLPEGIPISIKALCAHFSEGEILIARALRELEALGYLERRRERGPDGRIRTRTYVYDVPGARPGADIRPARRPDPRPRPVPRPAGTGPAPVPLTPAPRPVAAAGPAMAAGRTPAMASPGTAAAPATHTAPAAAADPEAVAVLAALRHCDPRLVVSEREAARLAPAVRQWLERGVEPGQIVEALTAGLPAHLIRRPARLLAYRLDAFRPLLPVPCEPCPPVRIPVPLQTCDGCDRAFRAPAPGRCRDCREDGGPGGAGPSQSVPRTVPGQTAGDMLKPTRACLTSPRPGQDGCR